MGQRIIRILIAGAFCVLAACSSEEKHAETPETLMAQAQEFEKAERYDEAIKRYQDIKNKFPYSKIAVEAELAIADAHFKDEAYPEAQASYQVFKDLHPKHEKVDYVTFRIGMSAFEQLPSTIDRDLSLAKTVITAFDELLVRFPTSSYADEAKEKKTECLKMLAAKEEYIANFYFRQEQYGAALPRYENLARDYPDLGFDEKAYSQGAISAKRAGDLDKARELLAQLKEKHPEASSQIKSVEEELR